LIVQDSRTAPGDFDIDLSIAAVANRLPLGYPHPPPRRIAMKFLSMIRVDEKSGQQPSERLMTEMGKLMDEMTRAGSLVTTAGLRPTAEGARVRSRFGKLSTTQGPFTETKEVIGGYAILEAKSLEEAIELTERFLKVHGDEWDLECEVRPLDGQDGVPCRKE
jgi:hypothetical protein